MMQNNFSDSIKLLEGKYIEQLVQIENECFSDPWTYDGFLYELSNKNAYFILAVSPDDEVMGYMGIHIIIDEGYIANVAVRERFRRMGVASALMAHSVSYANDNNLSILTLEVREGNFGAISFYEKYGFKVLGVRKGYYQKPLENGLIMTKFIGENENI